MRRDKKAPALYELVRGRTPIQRPPRRDTPAQPSKPSKRDHSPASRGDLDDESGLAILAWLSPGKIVKLPVGYMFFAGAGILVIIIGAYVAGYKKMEHQSDAQRRAEAQREPGDALGVDAPLFQVGPGSAAV